MLVCLDIVFSRFRIDFFHSYALLFKQPLVERSKWLDRSDVEWNEDGLFLSVGNFPAHTDSCIRTDDTASEVKTTVSESLKDDSYEVNLSFGFRNPTPEIMRRCMALDESPYPIRITHFGMDGKPRRYRVVRAEEGAMRAQVVDEGDTIRVEVTVAAVNGLQSLDAVPG